MSKKISIDPFTRIEGHLAISLDVENNYVEGAKCTGEMFRGFEQIMKGRSPLDAQQITQRICGVCPVSHGIASVLAQEDAYKLKIPDNGRIIRNIMLAGNYVQSHVTHFYHLSALDFVDVTGILNYHGKDRFLQGIKKWVQEEVSSKSLFPAAPFLPRFETKYLQDAELNITALKNYFTALDMRALAHQLVAIFAGKMPHMATLVPGGVTEKVTSKKIAQCRSKIAQLRSFFETSYIPDLLAVAQEFPEYWQYGKSYGNFLSYGVFQENEDNSLKLFPAGVLIQGQMSELDLEKITEQVKYSKYTSDSGFTKTTPEPHKQGAYSWIKAPRYGGKPMEVGPLARVMVAYYDNKPSDLKEATERFLSTTGISINTMDSCLGRHAARVIEMQVLFNHMEKWVEQLDPTKPTCADFNLPTSADGIGLTEAPRGGLGHWLSIQNSKVSTYECIVPTTWNCSPKDDQGIPGPVEKALLGTYIQDSKNPMEASRIVRSFDPCLACAVH